MSKANRKYRIESLDVACVGCPMFIEGGCREKNMSDKGKWAFVHVFPLHPEDATCADCADFPFCEKGGDPVLCSDEAVGIEWVCSVRSHD